MAEINIYVEIEKLLNFALYHNMIEDEDKIYFRNRLLAVLGLDSYDNIEETENQVKDLPIEKSYEILNRICDWAVSKEILEDTFDQRDLFDTKVILSKSRAIC